MIQNKFLWHSFFPQFPACQESSVKSLMQSAVVVELPAGEKVFYPGKHCENYLLLLEGKVKVFLLSENGREVLLYQVASGDSCILTTSCLLGNDQYPAEGICEDKVKAFAIPSHAFHRCLEHSSFFRDFVFSHFSSRLANVIERMDNVLFVGIEERLAKLLLAEHQPELSKTHQALANELGSVREVISRHLKRFEKYGWIRLSRGKIEILQADALRHLADNY